MSKKPFLIFFIIYFMYNLGVVTYYQYEEIYKFISPIQRIVNWKNLKIHKQFCADFVKLKPVLDSYSNIQWPIIGVPGIGLSSNESAVVDFCQYLQEVEQVEVKGEHLYISDSHNNRILVHLISQ